MIENKEKIEKPATQSQKINLLRGLLELMQSCKIAMLMFCFFFVSNAFASDFKISKDENCFIELPSQASATEKFAAEELQKYLLKISGAKCPMGTKKENSNSKRICIGKTELGLKFKEELKGKDQDSFIIANRKGNIFLIGNCDRATLYAVYTFLEEFGCRWVAPGVDYLPQKKELAFNKEKLIFTPGIKYRSLRYFSVEMRGDKSKEWHSQSVDWVVKNKINVLTDTFISETFPENIIKRGGCRGINNTHLTEQIFTDELYRNSPEIFAKDENEGTSYKPGKKRKGFGQQFCLSEEKSVSVYANKILKYINAHPEVELFPLTQADGNNFCKCSKCRDLYKKFGKDAIAKAWFAFEDKVAAKINQTHPGKKFYTLVYGITKTPPKDGKFDLNQNTMFIITHNEDFFHRYENAKNGNFLGLLKQWSTSAPNRIGVYDYYPFSIAKFLPYAATEKITSDIKTLYDMNCPYFEIQSGLRWCGMFLPIYYAGARAMWNPDVNIKEEMKVFHKGVYGYKAAPYLEKFFQTLEQAMSSYPIHWQGDSLAFLTKDVFNKAEKYLNKAILSEKNMDEQKRLQAIVDNFNYGKHLRWGRNASKAYTDSGNVKFAEDAVSYGNKIIKLTEEIQKEKGTRYDFGAIGKHTIGKGRSGIGVELGSWLASKENINQMVPIKKGIRVGVLTNCIGAEGLFAALKETKGIRAMKFSVINRQILNNFQVVIINNTGRRGAWLSNRAKAKTIREWIKNGGGIILLHDAIGYRKHKVMFPEIGSGMSNPRLNGFRKTEGKHDLNKGLDEGFIYKHGYYDHITLKPGKDGQTVIVNKENNPVAVAGRFGKGGVVLDGMLTGYGSNDDLSYFEKKPEGGELKIILNSINWLEKIKAKSRKRLKDIAVINPADKKTIKSYYKTQALSLYNFYKSKGCNVELVPRDVFAKSSTEQLNEYKIICLPKGSYKMTDEMIRHMSEFVFDGGLLVSSCHQLPPIAGIQTGKGMEIKDLFVELECPLTKNLPIKKWIPQNAFTCPGTSNINAVLLIQSKLVSKLYCQPYLTCRIYGKGAFVYLNKGPENETDKKILENCVSAETLDWLVLQ